MSLLCIAGAFVVAVALCSLANVPYGPVHTSLPFMLMGLGVDDTFVIMASWEEINSQSRHLHKPIHERVALALSHAGAAISVTSLTDVVAFIIGASTVSFAVLYVLPIKQFNANPIYNVFVSLSSDITVVKFVLHIRSCRSFRDIFTPGDIFRGFFYHRLRTSRKKT